jgi:two-component system chemotaxis response regulator CheB
MFSSLTLKGAETTLKSLHAGAVDVLAKDHSLHMGLGADTMGEVTSKIKQIYASRHSILSGTQALLARSKAPGARPVRTRPLKVGKDKIRAIAIGISTGGPLSLHDVLPELSESFTLPLFIVQHMPPRFTKTLADRLDSRCSHTVVEAEQGMIVQSGSIYLAPGGKHMTLIRGAGMVKIQVSDEPKDRLHRPSVDVLFESAAAVYGNQLLGLIMTGMGNDGTKGARAIKESGGLIYAQDEASCVVYGMPKAVTLAGLVDDVLSLSDIAPALNKLAQSSVRVVSA